MSVGKKIIYGVIIFFTFHIIIGIVWDIYDDARDKTFKSELAELEATFPPVEPIVAVLVETETVKEAKNEFPSSYNSQLEGLSKRMTIVDRNEIATVMKEHKFQESELSSDKKTAELGKFLNADYILRLDIIIKKNDEGERYVQSWICAFMNVNTLEKITFKGYYLEREDFSKLYEKDNSIKINGTWYFDCLQTGKIKSNKYKRITPFIPVDNPLEQSYSEKEQEKYIPKGLEKITIEDKNCVYNDSETGEVSFSNVMPTRIAKKKSASGYDGEGGYVTDANYGKISFRKDNKTYFSGTVFMYENQLAILVDKKGDNYYFLMFNK